MVDPTGVWGEHATMVALFGKNSSYGSKNQQSDYQTSGVSGKITPSDVVKAKTTTKALTEDQKVAVANQVAAEGQ